MVEVVEVSRAMTRTFVGVTLEIQHGVFIHCDTLSKRKRETHN